MGESWQNPQESDGSCGPGMYGRTGPHSTGKGPEPGLQKYRLTADDLLDYPVCRSRNVDIAVRGVAQELARNVERA